MTMIITIMNRIKGSGKTTICINLGKSLAGLGKNSLLIDGTDGDISDKLRLTRLGWLGEILEFRRPPSSMPTGFRGLSIIPGERESTRQALIPYYERKTAEHSLSDRFQNYDEQFDYWIFDTPTYIDYIKKYIFTSIQFNAIYMSDVVIIPVPLFQGSIDKTMDVIRILHLFKHKYSYYGMRCRIIGILPLFNPNMKDNSLIDISVLKDLITGQDFFIRFFPQITFENHILESYNNLVDEILDISAWLKRFHSR